MFCVEANKLGVERTTAGKKSTALPFSSALSRRRHLPSEPPPITHTMRPPLDVVAAVDQGTQSTRVFLYAVPSLAIVASHQVALTQHYPQPG